MSRKVLGTVSHSALAMAGSFDGLRILARLLVLALVVCVIGLFVVPWQQNVTGSGRVIAYAPLDREQPIEAPVDGRVTDWHVQEGDEVKAGDPLVDLSDNDPELIARLERQRDAVRDQLSAANLEIAVAESKIASLESARTSAVLVATLERDMARFRRDGAQRALDAAKATERTADLNLDRQRSLEGKGLSSTRQLELAELDAEVAEAGLDRAEAALKAADREVKAQLAERGKVDSETKAKTEDARASLQKAKAEKAKAQERLAKIDIELARQNTMKVVAPRDGTVFRLVAKQGGEMVKQGETLLVLVPDTTSRAVELWVDGNDVPLITKGRHVRIQFEGWPAVQFVGWPSVAVGTFGGTVDFVDATDDGSGKFRIVVVPDDGEPWPDARYLRQGVRANGWVLLNQVSIGYELWRQFNGFPPAVEPPKDAEESYAK